MGTGPWGQGHGDRATGTGPRGQGHGARATGTGPVSVAHLDLPAALDLLADDVELALAFDPLGEDGVLVTSLPGQLLLTHTHTHRERVDARRGHRYPG